MSNISAVSASSSNSRAKAAALPNVDFDTFLRLLVAQMKNQDPTEPMKETEYVAQLATFSNVEQAIAMNSTLAQILHVSVLNQASSLIGLHIETSDGAVSGIVDQVQVDAGKIVAVLGDGTQVLVDENVRISR